MTNDTKPLELPAPKDTSKLVYPNFKLMEEICLAPIESFAKYGTEYTTTAGRYFYKNNGANVLAIAHLDTVQDLRHFYYLQMGSRSIVYNAQLDDRLGAYIILDMLPRLGINVDVLLTEGEETGRSTGQYFEVPAEKNYNWMFQFDRAGHDVVMYQYETPELKNLVKDAGLTPGVGSFSDIAAMDHVGRSGINFGVGYHDNHGEAGYADIHEMIGMLNGFVRFYRNNADMMMPYTWKPAKTKLLPGLAQWWKKQDNRWDDWNTTSNYTVDDYLCDKCGRDCYTGVLNRQSWDSFGLCPDCVDEEGVKDTLDSLRQNITCVFCGSPISDTDISADLLTPGDEMCGYCIAYIEKKGKS